MENAPTVAVTCRARGFAPYYSDQSWNEPGRRWASFPERPEIVRMATYERIALRERLTRRKLQPSAYPHVAAFERIFKTARAVVIVSIVLLT